MKIYKMKLHCTIDDPAFGQAPSLWPQLFVAAESEEQAGRIAKEWYSDYDRVRVRTCEEVHPTAAVISQVYFHDI